MRTVAGIDGCVDYAIDEEETEAVSLTEVKSAIDKLSDEEQLHLRSYFQEKLLQNAEWRREISRRMREMDTGKKFTSEQVELLVRKLETEGR